MKINIYKSLPLLSLLFVACSTEDITSEDVVVEKNSSELKHITFSADVEADNSTRAVSDANGYVNWVADDQIKVYNRYYNSGNQSGDFGITQNLNNDYPYSFSGINAFFEGTLSISNNYNNEICAVYPASGFDVTYTTNNRTQNNFKVNSVTAAATLPSRQNLSEMSSAYQFMTARTSLPKGSTVGALKFHNVISWIKINVKSSTDFPISRIKIVANSDEFASAQIAGKFTVTVDENGVPSISSITSGSTFVEAYNEDYSTLDDGDYYFAVLPSAASKGLTVLLEDVKGNRAYQRVNTSFTFERNYIYNLGKYDMSADNIKSKILTDVVDLGLPSGTLWTTKNIDAVAYGSTTKFVESIYDNGGYYSWGEIYAYNQINSSDGTSKKTNYTEATYVYEQGGNMTKYNRNDNQTMLDSGDDVAYVQTNGIYCMPTYNQIYELYNQSSRTNYLTASNTYNGYNGVLFSGYGGKVSVWLPAGGSRYSVAGSNEQGQNMNTECQYWARTMNTYTALILVVIPETRYDQAHCLDIENSGIDNHNSLLHSGLTGDAAAWRDRRYSARTIRAVATNVAIAPINTINK